MLKNATFFPMVGPLQGSSPGTPMGPLRHCIKVDRVVCSLWSVVVTTGTTGGFGWATLTGKVFLDISLTGTGVGIVSPFLVGLCGPIVTVAGMVGL